MVIVASNNISEETLISLNQQVNISKYRFLISY